MVLVRIYKMNLNLNSFKRFLLKYSKQHYEYKKMPYMLTINIKNKPKT